MCGILFLVKQMGIIRYAFKGNYKDYYQKLKILGKKINKPPFILFLDTALSFIVCGSGLQDYLNYKFYDKSFKERKTYATIGYQNKFYQIAANYKYADFFSNKINFNHNFYKYVKRDCVSYDDGIAKVKDFIKNHKTIIRKPISGLGGADVTKIYTKDIKNLKEFYENLKLNNCLIEEEVIQNKEWNKLNPDSLNTIRVVTKCINGKSDVLYAVARIGSGESIVDNFHKGGVGVKVNLKKGTLEGNTIDKAGNISDITSKTFIKVDGFKIPYFKDMIKMVNEAAKVNDKVNIVGWDVALTNEGPVIIEGNRGPGMDIIQVLYNRGIKEDLEQIKKEIIESK
jgi:hypothetical protein